MVRLGIIRCAKSGNENRPTNLLPAESEASDIFKQLGPMELVGCVTCYLQPVKRTVEGAKLLAKWGADIIAFSIGDAENLTDYDNRLYEQLRRELAKQLKSTVLLDCRSGFGA